MTAASPIRWWFLTEATKGVRHLNGDGSGFRSKHLERGREKSRASTIWVLLVMVPAPQRVIWGTLKKRGKGRQTKEQPMGRAMDYDRNWMKRIKPGVPFRMRLRPKGEAGMKATQLEKRRLRDLGELLTVREAALKLKVDERTIYGWIYAGRLKKTPVGRHIRIAETDLEAFLNA